MPVHLVACAGDFGAYTEETLRKSQSENVAQQATVERLGFTTSTGLAGPVEIVGTGR
jgi:hypothetical protein